MRALGIAIAGVTALFTVEAKRFESPTGPAVEAQAALAEGLARAEESGTLRDQKIKILAAATARAVELLEPHSPAWDRLQSLMQKLDEQGGPERYDDLKRTANSVARDLAFEPKFEAELPVGFPTYTPVGAIELKTYPRYRMASGKSFWTLFQHIQQNRIEMTAPVQMSFTAGEQGEMQQSKMSFLYGRREIGTPGDHGKVTVVDNAAHTVVSLGMRGARSKEALLDARQRLQMWIKDNQQYEAAGTMRVMGYNSPAVPRRNQFYEVQIPLKKVPGTPPATDAS